MGQVWGKALSTRGRRLISAALLRPFLHSVQVHMWMERAGSQARHGEREPGQTTEVECWEGWARAQGWRWGQLQMVMGRML